MKVQSKSISMFFKESFPTLKNAFQEKLNYNLNTKLIQLSALLKKYLTQVRILCSNEFYGEDTMYDKFINYQWCNVF